MSIRKTVLFGLAPPLVMLNLACPFVDSRINNQGGGNIVSAASKVAQGQLSRLTADEIQVVGDSLAQANPEFDLIITDEQAQAASDFLVQNHINTLDDLEALADNPGQIVIPETLEALINSGLDPESIIIEAARVADAAG